MPTVIPAPSHEPRLPLPGAALTRRAVTVITAVIFSFRVSRGCDLRRRVADSVVDAMAAA